MVHFVGAGPGAPDLITVRGARLIGEADVIIYAGSLVNPALLEMKKESCRVCDSAKMTLEEVIETIKEAEKRAYDGAAAHGDPCVYGAVREQMDLLEGRHPLRFHTGCELFSRPSRSGSGVYPARNLTECGHHQMAGRTPVRTENLLKPCGARRRWSFSEHRSSGGAEQAARTAAMRLIRRLRLSTKPPAGRENISARSKPHRRRRHTESQRPP